MPRMKGLAPRMGELGPRVSYPEKEPDPFYTSPAWRKVSGKVKRERKCCERCGSRRRLIVDHIVERKDGGDDLDEDNLELLCGDCHNQKTAKARAARARGAG